MANATNRFIDVNCIKCNNKYKISLDKIKRRERSNVPNLCPCCMKSYQNDKRKEYFNSLSDEEKQKFRDNRNWYKNLSDEEKKIHAQRTKDQISARTKLDLELIRKKSSEGLKKHWKSYSEERKIQRLTPMRVGNKQYWDSMNDNEKSIRGKKWLDDLSPTDREKILSYYKDRMIEYNNTLSSEEKHTRAKHMEQWCKDINESQKKELYSKTHEWYHALSDEKKEEYANLKREYYHNLSDEEKQEFIDKSDWYSKLDDESKIAYAKNQKSDWDNLSADDKKYRIRSALSGSNGNNNLHQRFENQFKDSYMSNNFYIINEVILGVNVIHSWDYGIYDKETNTLQMVIDLDGSYYHADNCDYDGLHSKEEYDERRSLSITDDTKYCIIYESKFKQSFEEMMKLVMVDYNQFIDYLFQQCRSIDFPFPQYTDAELIKSYSSLERMDCNSKYIDTSINTRIGDRLIQHFHPSIYHANRHGSISPYEAWYDDDMLIKVIQNRVIYQSTINPNKILQGFNISKIGQKVSVFSAGRAKLLIQRYLNDINEIFDPFSGFSGRMLGAISLGKQYIGQDISEIHVNESNSILKFIRNDKTIYTDVKVSDLLQSHGEYESLFTCPPYGNKEQWYGVLIDQRSCDDWIDECLSRFKCKRYLFVVDETMRYKDYIVDEIVNKSHFGGNNEYVIMIDR